MVSLNGIARAWKMKARGCSCKRIAAFLKVEEQDIELLFAKNLTGEEGKQWLRSRYSETYKKNKAKRRLAFDTKRKESPLGLFKIRIDRFRHKNRVKGEPLPPIIRAEDIINKFGPNPRCYLTGQPIDYFKPETYHFEHKVPVSSGGKNTLENLMLATPEANRMKGKLSLNEFIQLCRIIGETCKGTPL